MPPRPRSSSISASWAGRSSSALAGEYSFSLALALGLFALGAIAYSVRTGRRVWLAVLLLVATVLSHVVVGMFAGAGAVVIVAVAMTRRSRWRSLAVAAVIGGVAALLTAFWSLPLVATFPYTQNMRYTKLTQYLDYLILDQWTWVYVLAIVGVALSIAFRDRAGIIVAIFTALWAVVFRFWPEAHAWNLRFLPFWYLGVFLLAAIGAAEVIRRLSGELARLWTGPPPDTSEAYEFPGPRERRVYRTVASVSMLVVLACVTTAGIWVSFAHRGFLPFWVSWNETGYENAARVDTIPPRRRTPASSTPSTARSIDRMDRLPPGRALWEGGPSLDAYGTPLALMLLPYWTHGRIQSFEGLYYESAASTSPVFMTISPLSASENSSDPVRGLDYLDLDHFDDGVRYLRALGGRYYLAHSEAAKAAADKSPGLRLLADGPRPRRPTARSVEDLRGPGARAGRPDAVRARRGVVDDGHAGPVLRPSARWRRRPDARRLGVHRRGLVVEPVQPRASAGRGRPGVMAAFDPGPRPPASRAGRCRPTPSPRFTKRTTTSHSGCRAPACRSWCGPRTSRTGRRPAPRGRGA